MKNLQRLPKFRNMKKLLNQKVLKKPQIMRKWNLSLKGFNTWPRRRKLEAVALEDQVQ